MRCAHRIPKPRPSSHQRYPAEYSCKISQLYKAGNMVTVLAKLSVHSTCAIVREQILKPRPSSHRPCPTECSCQFSQLYKAGNTVTVLAKLAAHALLVIMCAADYNIPKAKPSSHWPSPTEHSCQFSQLYKAGSTLTVLAKLAAHALHAILHAACTRSRNKDPLTIGHVHLNVHVSCLYKAETR